MTRQLKHFLLVFDHDLGKLIDQREFADSETAVAAYFEAEQAHEDSQLVEVVLIGSDSLDTVRLTHANYFDGSATVSRFLAEL